MTDIIPDGVLGAGVLDLALADVQRLKGALREARADLLRVTQERNAERRCRVEDAARTLDAEAALHALRARHSDLVAAWRARAESQGAIYAQGLLECADDLSALLAPETADQP